MAQNLLTKQFNGLNIQVYGSYEEPLFKAKDIGESLEMSNIREIIKNFNCKQRCDVSLTDAIGRDQKTTFLTEQGLYKVIMRSRKKIAEDFQDWVCEVLEEIRRNGKYDLEEQLKQKEIKELEYQRQLEEKEQELEMYKQKTYEDIEKTGHIYVIKTDAQGAYKVGKTKDNVTKRIKGMQTANVNNIEIVLDYPTSNPDLLEKCVHYILDRYRCNSNREFFDCNIDYIKTIVNICGHTIDTLKSTYQHITKEELYSKMNRLGLEIKEYEIEHERIIDRFVKKYIRKGGDGVRWTELITTYNNWCYRELNERGYERLDKKDLKRYFEMYVFKSKEQPLRYVGRGWHGWSISK